MPLDRRVFLRRAAGLSASFTLSKGVAFGTPLWHVSGGAPALSTEGRDYDYELNYIASYGQSLALGGDGMAAISLKQRFDSLMFSGGTRPLLGGTTLAARYGALVPLVENDNPTNTTEWSAYGTDNAGETVLSGTTEAIKELMISEDGASPKAFPKYRLLGSCPGHGGLSVASLSRGSHSYNRLLSEVSYAKAFAKTMRLTFGVPLITWMQGEADIETDPNTYEESLVQLIADLGADIHAITGQGREPLFLMYQTSQHGGFPIACAQLRVSQRVSNAQVATPTYPFPVSVNPHLTGVGYKMHGAYFGAAFKNIHVNGTEWRPLSMKAVAYKGKSISIGLHVPAAPVVADTEHVTATNPAKAAFGFSLLDENGKAVDIDGRVSVTGPGTISIQSPVAVQPGFQLRYGDMVDGCGGGNIRDSQGDTYTFNGGGLDVPMHNWLTVFAYTFS